MKVKVRFTRTSFVGRPLLGDKAVALPEELVSAQQADFIFNCPDEVFFAEDATEFDRLMWDAFELYRGFEYPIATPAPGGWTRYWSSWTWDGHPMPAEEQLYG